MILYKYFPCNVNSFKSISLRSIWCDNHRTMNDPFECLAIAKRNLSITELDNLRMLCLKSKNPQLLRIAKLENTLLENLFNEMREKSLAQYAFCSLSETFDDILMWSHYASSHRGFVFGFEFENLKDHTLQKVQYLTALGKMDFSSYLKVMEKDYHIDNMNAIFQDYSSKSVNWSYEKEWRIWRREPSYYSFEPQELKEIYFGINCDIETKSIIVNLTSSYLNKGFIFKEMEFADNPVRLKY